MPTLCSHRWPAEELGLLEAAVSSDLFSVNETHSQNHITQQELLRDVLDTLSAVDRDMAAVVRDKADRNDTAQALGALGDRITASVDLLNSKVRCEQG